MLFGKVVTSVWLIQLCLSPPPILEKIGRLSKIPFAFCTFQPRKESGTSSKKQKNRKNKNKVPQTDTGKPAAQEPKEQVRHSQEQPTSTAASTATERPR